MAPSAAVVAAVIATIVGAASGFQVGVLLPPTGVVVRAASPSMTAAGTFRDAYNAAKANEEDAVFISLTGRIPANAHRDVPASLGLFVNKGTVVNGKPAYQHDTRPNTMLWSMPNGDWCIGLKRELGSGTCLMSKHMGKWKILDNGAGWVDNVGVKVTRGGEPPPQEADTSLFWGQRQDVASSRSFEERAEGRKRADQRRRTADAEAIRHAVTPPSAAYLEARKAAVVKPAARAMEVERASVASSVGTRVGSEMRDAEGRAAKRGERAQSAGEGPVVGSRARAERLRGDLENEVSHEQAEDAMKTRVATARSLAARSAATTDVKYKELIKPALDAYMANQIDEDELRRCKQDALAIAERDLLTGLEAAYGEYEAAVAARAAAEATQDEAETKLVTILRSVETGANTAGLVDENFTPRPRPPLGNSLLELGGGDIVIG